MTDRLPHGPQRPRVEGIRLLRRKWRHWQHELEAPHARPATRADCEHGVRPCPYVGCKYHLFLDALPNGGIRFNFPDREPHEMVESCALDVAQSQSPLTLDEVGELLNLTRERVRQVEEVALRRVRLPIVRELLSGDAPLPEAAE